MGARASAVPRRPSPAHATLLREMHDATACGSTRPCRQGHEKEAPRMSKSLTIGIDKAIADPALLGAALGPIDSWRTWLVALKAAFGLELDRRGARAPSSMPAVASRRQRC